MFSNSLIKNAKIDGLKWKCRTLSITYVVYSTTTKMAKSQKELENYILATKECLKSVPFITTREAYDMAKKYLEFTKTIIWINYDDDDDLLADFEEATDLSQIVVEWHESTKTK